MPDEIPNMKRFYLFLLEIIRDLYNRAIFSIAILRASYWRLFLKKLGKGSYIMDNCRIYNPAGIEIGSYTGINHHTDVGGGGGLVIGRHVMIGPYCQILTTVHQSDDWQKPMSKQKFKSGPVVIGDDVWIGTHVVILPNVKIGRGAIIGAGAVVTRDVQPYSVAGGVPAKHIKFRFTPKYIQQAEKVDLSRFRLWPWERDLPDPSVKK